MVGCGPSQTRPSTTKPSSNKHCAGPLTSYAPIAVPNLCQKQRRKQTGDMRFPSSALHLPGSLLLLIAAQIDAQQIPTAIRKMSPDQGEKFFHEYCAFDSTASQQQAALLAPPLPAPKPAVAARQLFDLEDARAIAANSSTPLGPRPPFAPHLAQQPPDDSAWGWELVRRAAEALAGLERRQWECPGGTTACLNIGYPNSCCATEETCFIVTETGFPIVGCCPKGETCGGSVAPCPEGDVSCPASLGGGCCISGFVCQGVGCEFPRAYFPACWAIPGLFFRLYYMERLTLSVHSQASQAPHQWSWSPPHQRPSYPRRPRPPSSSRSSSPRRLP